MEPKIRVLEEAVVKKIAAGEVIERPASVVRELLDNSLDAHSQNIHVFLEKGGMVSIRVEDDGVGMSSEDAQLCFLSHATSKIRTVEDLQAVKTLGFRGEALGSLAHCSLLTVTTKDAASNLGVTLKVREGYLMRSSSRERHRGTTIEINDLFFSLPARKKFLKGPSTESNLVRRVFEEKALAFPSVAMSLYYNQKLRFAFPQEDWVSRCLRIARLSPYRAQFLDFSVEKPDLSITFLAGLPSLYRRDRKGILAYINRRLILDYAFSHALEMAYREFLPPGLWPVCFVFIQTSPHNVDFNVHPAKKDIRLSNSFAQYLHQTVVEALLGFLHTHARKRLERSSDMLETNQETLQFSRSSQEIGPHKIVFPQKSVTDPSPEAQNQFRYLGQLFRVFLLLEKEDSLIIVDQHAAHERLLFDDFTKGKFQNQRLLIPYRFSVEPGVEKLFKKRLDLYKEVGIHIEEDSSDPQKFSIVAIPSESLALGQDIIKLIREQKGSLADVRRRLFANLACQSAIKAGDTLSPDTAISLIRQTLTLDNAHCPHGRPVFVTMSRDKLYTLLQRRI